jgi:uncharacterized protein YbjT (DUF2867 family)
MILVTSAAGLTGRHVVRALAGAGHDVLGMVHRREQEAAVRAAGARKAVVGDLLDVASVRAAMAGTTAVYHVCPRMSKDEVTIGQTMIQAAQEIGVRHFVFHSAIHSLLTGLPHHANKLQVERLLIESELPYTILQPARYMQNVLVNWPTIVQRGTYTVPYSPESRMCLVDLEDVALVAARVLGDESHFGATYNLDGQESLSAVEEATIIGALLGRDVAAVRVSTEEWRRAVETIRTPSQIEYLLKMFEYYDRYGLRPGNPNVLGWLLGRSPSAYEDFIVRTINETSRAASPDSHG